MSGFPLLLIGVIWALLVYNLGAQWTAYEQYNYGWAVPLLCLYLLFQRWQNRPAPAHREATKPVTGLIIACAVLLFPLRLLHEANPTWRLTSLIWTGQVILLTLGFIYLTGGRIWLRHFAFPICFFFVAVPWPTGLESLVIHSLTRLNVGSTIEILGVFGIPALQHGNVLEVGTGMVGVDEACSGIRSFQTTLMLALFFGELYSLTALRRLACVLAGFAFSFLFNVVRTTLLATVAAKHGTDAVASWHDPAGITILIGCFVSLWLVAWLMRNPPNTQSREETAPPFLFRNSLPTGAVAALASLVLVSEAAPRLFYHIVESRRPILPRWTVIIPADSGPFEEMPFAKKTRDLLRYDEGQNVAWHEPDGSRWQMFFLRWNPGRVSGHLARLHTPEACLPATGMQLTPLPGLRRFETAGIQLPFRVFRTEYRGMRGFVFYCRWGDRGDTQTEPSGESTRWQRVRAVLHGRGNQGMQVLELAVWGIDSETEAQTELQRQLDRFVHLVGAEGQICNPKQAAILRVVD